MRHPRFVLRALVSASVAVTLALLVDAGLNGRFTWWGLDPRARATLGLSVVLVLYVATFLVYWWPRRLQARPFTLVAAIGLAVAGGLLGLVSYWGCEGQQALGWTPLNQTLGLFIGSVDDPFTKGSASCPAPAPVALQVARLAALLATLTTVVAAIVQVFRDQWDRIQVRLARTVVVVVGLDAQSMRLLEVLATNPSVTHLVVGVDTELGAPHAAEARAFGARVLVSNQADNSWLRTVAHTTVRAAYLLSPRPEENMQWFDDFERFAQARAQSQAQGQSRWSESSRVIVRLDDPWEADYWRRGHVLKAGGVLLDTIGVLQVTAQELIDHAVEQNVDHLVVLGDSPLSYAVIDELAQQWREEETMGAPRTFDVTLVDPQAELLWLDHELHERALGNEPLQVVRVAAVADLEVLSDVVGDDRAAGASADAAVVVLDCRYPSAAQFRAAQRIAAARPRWHVLARREDSLGIDERPVVPNLVPFGVTLVGRHGVPEDGWTRIARRLHTTYIANVGPSDDPARQPWDRLDDFYKVGNLRQIARTLLIAERAGRTWDPGDGTRRPQPLTEEEVAELAHLEHEDWYAYYVANGWTLGPRDSKARTRQSLKPWAELSPQDQEATISGVTHSLQQLTTLGYRPFGDPVGVAAPPARYERRGTVTAVRLDEPWTWITDNGDLMEAAAGDWRLTEDGRTWSVLDDAFRETYRHLEGDRYARTGTVTARNVSAVERVQTMEGPVTALPGDWAVEDDEGRRWVVPGEQFAKNYAAS